MSKSFEIVVTRPVKSRNQLDKMHWRARHRERQAWQQAIKYEGFNGKVPKFRGKVHVVISSVRSRMLDKDNLIGGCKPIFDALKQLGVIVDDKPKFLFAEVIQEKGKFKHTRIRIGEMSKSSGSEFTHSEIEEMLAEHSQQIHDDAPWIIRQLLDEIKGKQNQPAIRQQKNGDLIIDGIGRVRAQAVGYHAGTTKNTKIVFQNHKDKSFFVIEYGALLDAQKYELTHRSSITGHACFGVLVE